MDIKEAIEKLEKSRDFCEWKKSNEKAHLSYAMCMLEDSSKNQWKIGYYNIPNDKTTTFSIGQNINLENEEEVFKKEETVMRELRLEHLKLSLKEAIHLADEFKKEKFPKELPVKKIAIAQHLDNAGEIWNITYITKALNVLNMKINANTGKVVSSDIESVLSFRGD